VQTRRASTYNSVLSKLSSKNRGDREKKGEVLIGKPRVKVTPTQGVGARGQKCPCKGEGERSKERISDRKKKTENHALSLSWPKEEGRRNKCRATDETIKSRWGRGAFHSNRKIFRGGRRGEVKYSSGLRGSALKTGKSQSTSHGKA